jgi:type IV pilus assembly protein PilF
MRPEAALALLLALATAGSPAIAAGKAVKSGRARSAASELSEAGRSDVMLAQAYLQAGRIEAAEDRARAAIASDGGSALPHVTMAMVRARQKQDGKARAEFERALKLAPADGAVLNSYGAWLCARGDRKGADDAFRRALADQSYDSPIQPLVNAGQCASRAGDWQQADGYLRRAIAMAPGNRVVLLMLAEAQLQLGRPLEARAFVQRADALGPDPNTLLMAARAEDAAGDKAASARYRQRLREEFPAYTPTAEGARKQ